MYGIVARYAVHWHFVGETYGTNQYLKNSVMHDNYLRCATIHHTSSILVKNNVAFNTSGHCFYLGMKFYFNFSYFSLFLIFALSYSQFRFGGNDYRFLINFKSDTKISVKRKWNKFL